MEGADGSDDLLDWETLYSLPVSNATWNTTAWTPNGWNITAANTTWWEASAPFDSPAALLRAAAKAILLGLLILATVVGTVYFILTTNRFDISCINRKPLGILSIYSMVILV